MRIPQPISTLTLTVALAVAPVLAAAVAADTRLEMKSHTDAFQMMGQSQPAQDKTIRFWVADDRVLRDDGETAFLYRGDQDKLYLIDHGAKSYRSCRCRWRSAAAAARSRRPSHLGGGQLEDLDVLDRLSFSPLSV
jgi:hypothetical protein